MDRMIRHVYTTDLPDPSRYLTPGDLVLTGLIWCRAPGDADRFVSALVKARRIEELTGRDLSCLDDQVDFFLALRIR
jgi:hypothetical protein